MGDGLLWPDFVHQKPSQTLQKLSFEGGSQVQLPPSRDKGGCGYSVVSNSRGSLFFWKKELVGTHQRTYPKLSVLWWKPPIPWKCSKFETRGSLFDSEVFSENPNQQFCGCIRKLLLLLNFRKTKKPSTQGQIYTMKELLQCTQNWAENNFHTAFCWGVGCCSV